MKNKKKIDADTKVYLEALGELREDDITKHYLVPLFRSMGFDRVEFHGGPGEKGKDLIASKLNPPHPNPLVTVVQTKKIRKTQTSTQSVQMSKLILQLQQCFSNEIPSIDGYRAKPDYVWLASPSSISTRLIEELEGTLNLPNPKRINVLDGPRIIELIKLHCPEILEKLISFENKIGIQNLSQLKNVELFSALRQTEFDIVSTYSDLSFFVGTTETSLIISGDFETIDQNYRLNEAVFKNSLCFLDQLSSRIGQNVLIPNLQSILDKHKSESAKYNSKLNQTDQLFLETVPIQYKDILDSTRVALATVSTQVSALGERSNTKSRQKIVKTIDTLSKRILQSADIPATLESIYTVSKEELSSQIDSLGDSKLSSSYRKYLEQIQSGLELTIKITEARARYIKKPKYDFSIDTIYLNNWITKRSDKYKSTLKKVENGEITNGNKLLQFLTETQKTLEGVDLIRTTFDKINGKIEFELNRHKPINRVSLSPHDVFDTGIDIAVYGSAGAGKTTTLQVYAKNYDKEGLLLYLPLNRIVEKYLDSIQSMKGNDRKSESRSHRLILKFILLSKSLNVTDNQLGNLENVLKTQNRTVVILDGLDEAYSRIPTILEAITEFKDRYGKSQLIISSRDCATFIQDIDFLGITLLPFTTPQLSKFVYGCLEDQEASKLLKHIETHNLRDIVKTPLLASIACTLSKQGIELPATEVSLYEKRISLLSGEYDTHKKINRQSQPKSTLQSAAQKIAYHFHSLGERHFDQEDAISVLRSNMSFRFQEEVCSVAFKELVDPCNILLLDHLSNQYSFGHLRHQEFLASAELRNSRDSDFVALLPQGWWQGALFLYAQANDIWSILEIVSQQEQGWTRFESNLRAMILGRPEPEKSALQETLDRNLTIDINFPESHLYDDEINDEIEFLDEYGAMVRLPADDEELK